MLRRLHPIQPEAFVFSNKNKAWAKEQIKKFPKGREASAIIPLLWRAQEQEGWLSRPAIEYVADFLGMNYIRALEVATFYFMYHLKPVGSIAHVQVCGTTSCMICGSENLMDICKELISVEQNTLSEDGKFSWEEVECLGACSNAPMIQIGKDYYEDLNAESFKNIIETFRSGKIPRAGSQTGRYSSEPLKGLTSLKDHESDKNQFNASVQLADSFGDTVKRINPNKIKNAAVVKE
ncbi:MAG: NADH-quinone oxidoreductase subunit NuoE [Rhodobacteraceae bacterium]|mgnify:FL=1|nr:NADH-quinone oxidoreductase subunit NuoE [Paracoccaceae bacterium]MBT4778180.1 NADH-quinone oxidoreductase subunit NuoE [Paracoccaceae bacterium]